MGVHRVEEDGVMIDEGILTRALQTAFNAASATLIGVTVERGQRMNMDPGRCPWLGIYPGTVGSKPKTLGAGPARWNNTAEPQVIIQTMDFSGDGQVASDQLETLIQAVLAVIDLDLTLGVGGARVIGVTREYRYVQFDTDESGSLFMPQVLIKLQMEVRSA